MSDWAKDYYAAVDSMDLEKFAAYHTEDARLRFSNAPRAEGKQALMDGISHFWETINGLRHDFVEVWEEDDTTIVEASITYTRKDDRQVVVPCTTILRKDGDLARDVRIFIDVSPVYTEEIPPSVEAGAASDS